VSIRQILVALWRRKWIIVAVTLLAAVVAAAYLYRLNPSYQSQVTVRLSPTISNAATSGELGGLPVSADPTIITSPDVLDPAAEALGEPKGALYGTVAYAPATTNVATASTLLDLSVTAPDAALAQARANAVVKSLNTYLDAMVSTTLDQLNVRYKKAGEDATKYRKELTKNPDDPLAQTNLATATTTLTTLSTQISALEVAGPSVTVTSPATMGSSTNPRLPIVIAIAFVCGLLAGAALGLVRDHFDDRLRDDDDLEDLTDVPVLAALANDRAVARKRERLPTASTHRTALSEGMRSLRTSVQVLLPEGRGVVAITSVEPGDGKTFVAANLALSWARSGRKVILVGGDLRRPELPSYFESAGEDRGLGTLLADAADAKKALSNAQITAALQSTPYRGLRVLPAGDPRGYGEPADLLASAPLQRIIRLLARNADLVVIDTPPALALADASELAAYADGMIVLASVGRTRKELIVDTVDALRANGLNLLGLVVNRSRRKLPKSYGSYYLRQTADKRRHGAAIAAALVAESQRTDTTTTAQVGTAEEQRPTIEASVGERRRRRGDSGDPEDDSREHDEDTAEHDNRLDASEDDVELPDTISGDVADVEDVHLPHVAADGETVDAEDAHTDEQSEANSER
jgi:capsular exopolysaccharide synthesis family protein